MIIGLDRVRATDIPLVGGKGANLGELIAAGLPVPGGFCVTAEAYRTAMTPLREEIAGLLETGNHDRLRELVAAAPLPDGLADRIRDAAGDLDGPVAVRSSATAEDLPDASFAGQQETYLGVAGGDAVVEAVRRCWASLWSDRAIAYRDEQGFTHDDVALAVVVQRMIPADAAGVAFTLDPVTGLGRVVIESAWGLGEVVVSGAVTPDSFAVERGRIAERHIGDKRIRIDMTATGETATTEIPDEQRGRASLTDRDVVAVARLAEQVERHYGRPMDVEWALAGGKPWLLQARPITTAAPVGPDRRVGRTSRFIRNDIIEHFPSPYPLDVMMVDCLVRCLDATAGFAGLRMRPIDGLVEMDADGAVTIGHPRISWWRLPTGIVRIARTPWRDPRGWDVDTGAEVRRFTARLRDLPVATLPGVGIADALVDAFGQVEAMVTSRFVDYLGFHVLRGVRLRLLLRLARVKTRPEDLLGDLDYATVVVDRELGRLVAAIPEPVRQLLAQDPIDVDAVARRDPGWWGRAERFLAEHGARTTRMYQPFSSRSWREDLPAFLGTVAMMAHTERREPVAARPHADLMAEAAGRLPRFLRRRFRRLVDDYRAGHVTREAGVVDFEELGEQMRRLALEAGRRMATAGLLAEPGEVALLGFDELLGWLRGEPVDVAGIVERRRRARPRALAAWQPEHDPVKPGSGMTGVAASPGVISGPVRVISGPAEFARLRPGDVLVCQATDPAWTPLFASASAVVTETGGLLSHAAIVAREFGIPAVLGVLEVTTRLHDGQVVTVDGSAGRVRTEEPPAPLPAETGDNGRSSPRFPVAPGGG